MISTVPTEDGLVEYSILVIIITIFDIIFNKIRFNSINSQGWIDLLFGQKLLKNEVRRRINNLMIYINYHVKNVFFYNKFEELERLTPMIDFNPKKKKDRAYFNKYLEILDYVQKDLRGNGRKKKTKTIK